MRLSSIVALAGRGFFVGIFFEGGGGVEKGRFCRRFLKKWVFGRGVLVVKTWWDAWWTWCFGW
jgi:hypothetical protein